MYVASQAWDSRMGLGEGAAVTPFEDACRLSAMPQCTLCLGQCACTDSELLTSEFHYISALSSPLEVRK